MDIENRNKLIKQEFLYLGRSPKWIAKKVDLTSARIRQILGSKHINVGKIVSLRKRKFSPLEQLEIKKLYESGLNSYELAKQKDVHPDTIVDCVKKFNGEIRGISNRKLVKCDYCGKEISKKASELKDRDHVFCDRDCYRKWQKQQSLLEQGYCGNWVELFELVNERNQKNTKLSPAQRL